MVRATKPPGIIAVMSAIAVLVATSSRIAAAQDPADTLLPRRSYFGARLAGVPDSLLARGTPPGALIAGFTQDSPAERAGLRVGDVIVRIGDRRIGTVADALPILRSLRVGSVQPIAADRGGHAVRLVYSPQAWPRESPPDFDVWYTSVAAGGGRRRVIVTHPRDGARHPAVLLVGGIGCFSVDSPSGIDPYRDLLYHLTRRGYATVRVEKSGVGDSQGDPCAGVDFQTEFSGYAAALGSMKHYPFVDSTRVFVFGHSIGGIEGPLLVSRDSSGPPVLGIAVLSTVGIGWYEYELANSRRQNRLSGATPDSVEESMKRKTRCAYRLLIARESSVGIIASDPECKPYFVYPASDAYMQQVAAINLGATWSGVHAPALVMYPGSDFITSRDEHLQLVDAINAMHPGSATFADVPGMDHHLAAEPSQQAAYADPTPPAIRPYFGATLEPIVDAWLDRIALRGATAPSRAQTATDSGRFTIYKLQHPVGAETWSRVTTGDHSTLSVSWAFRYIGSNVRLNASLASAPDGAPRQLEAHGQTSTLTDVDLSVALAPDSAIVVERGVRRVVHASRAAFPIFHYPPVAIEEALFRYCCLRQTRPAPARLLPSGQATFAQRGTDTLRGPSGTSVVLRRYCVSGLLWGRQSMWATADGRIVAVVNGDAELDRFEAVRAGYEHLLPDFVRGAVRDGLADLEAAARHAPPSRIGAYAIVGARIIDGTGAPPIADGVVIIRDGRIEAVGPAGRVLVPANLPREDARGKTIIPGLWDMHVHFEQVEWPAAQLAAGVTTARDMGNELELATGLRDAIAGSRVPGPRLLLAGLIDGAPDGLGAFVAATPDDAKAIVNRYHEAGYQQIKIYGSLPPALVPVVTAEAHQLGMTVTGHVPRGMSARQFVEAGADQINHLGYVLSAVQAAPPAGQPRPPLDLTSASALEAIAFFKSHGTVLDPTLARSEQNSHPKDSAFAAYEPGAAHAPPELLEALNASGAPGNVAPTRMLSLERGSKLVPALMRAGVPIVAGTDLVVPGYSIGRELELYVRAGMSPMEALQSASIVPARVMNMGKESGTLETGKRADLVILDANPLDDVSNVRRVHAVVAAGRLYLPAPLWRTAGFSP